MIVDISFEDLKKMLQGGGNLLRNETSTLIILYYPGKTIVYRTVIKKPQDNMKYLLLLGSLPESMRVWNVREFGGINE